MSMRDCFRWTYVSVGLWLLVSPFLLFGGHASLMNGRIGETGLLMSSGLAALCVACLARPKQDVVQAMAGYALGLSMIAAPRVLGFDEGSAVTWNATVFGSVFLITAVLEIYDHWAGQDAR